MGRLVWTGGVGSSLVVHLDHPSACKMPRVLWLDGGASDYGLGGCGFDNCRDPLLLSASGCRTWQDFVGDRSRRREADRSIRRGILWGSWPGLPVRIRCGHAEPGMSVQVEGSGITDRVSAVTATPQNGAVFDGIPG
jgi:hypothetical protein